MEKKKGLELIGSGHTEKLQNLALLLDLNEAQEIIRDFSEMKQNYACNSCLKRIEGLGYEIISLGEDVHRFYLDRHCYENIVDVSNYN